MDIGLNTALLDSFRRDDVPRDVRLLAAQGAFAPRAIDQLGLLALLASDPDTDVRETVEKTIARISPDVIGSLIARSDVSSDLREFFVARGVTPRSTPDADPDRPLLEEDDTDHDTDPATEADKESLLARLAAMSVPEKVKAAMKGSREVRNVLVRDSNKLVALSVLSSPKLTETEVESIARMGSVSEDVLRAISRRRSWIKNYNVVLALTKNAKSPVAISMQLLGRLNAGDLKKLSTDRNIPEALRIAARKRVVIA